MFSKLKLQNIFWVYLLTIIIISLLDIFLIQKNNNYLIFHYTYEHFLNKQNLYVHYAQQYFDLYKYSPLFSIFMSPFYIFGSKLGSILWNIFNAMTVFFGISVQKLTTTQKISCLLIVFPEIINNAHNFQSNSLIAGCALFSFYFMEKNKFYFANLLFQFLLILKLYGFFFIYQFGFLKIKQNLKQVLFFITSLSFLFLICVYITDLTFIKNQFGAFYHLLTYERSGYGMSLMGFMHLFLNFNGNTQVVQLIGLSSFLILFLLVWKDKNDNIYNKYSLFIFALVFIVIFNHRSESPTMIIASVGVSLYLVLFHQGRILKNWVFWMKMIGVSLVQTDLVPRVIRDHYIYPYNVKVMPFIIFYFYFYLVFLFNYRKNGFPPSRE